MQGNLRFRSRHILAALGALTALTTAPTVAKGAVVTPQVITPQVVTPHVAPAPTTPAPAPPPSTPDPSPAPPAATEAVDPAPSASSGPGGTVGSAPSGPAPGASPSGNLNPLRDLAYHLDPACGRECKEAWFAYSLTMYMQAPDDGFDQPIDPGIGWLDQAIELADEINAYWDPATEGPEEYMGRQALQYEMQVKREAGELDTDPLGYDMSPWQRAYRSGEGGPMRDPAPAADPSLSDLAPPESSTVDDFGALPSDPLDDLGDPGNGSGTLFDLPEPLQIAQ